MQRFLFFLAALLLETSAWAQMGTIEYKTTLTGSSQAVSSTSKVFYANGNVRTEVNLAIPGVPRSMKQTILLLSSEPNTLYMLDEANRTFSETKLSSMDKAGTSKTTVRVVGKEKVKNLNCTHAVINMDQGSMDVWTTKEIPGYEGMQAFLRSNRGMGTENLYNELKKKGADGFFVRMTTNTGPGQMIMELARYDTKPVPASLFKVPNGYKKVDSFDPQKMMNMSPAERQKLMQEIQKRQSRQK